MRIIENWIRFTYKKREWKRNKHCNSFIDNQAVTKKKTSRHKVNIKRNVEQKCYEWKKRDKNIRSGEILQQDYVRTENISHALHCFRFSLSSALLKSHFKSQMNSSNGKKYAYLFHWVDLIALSLSLYHSRSVCDYSIFDGYGASIAWYRPLFQLRFLSTFFLLIFFSILHIRRKKKRTEDALKPASRSN